MELTDAIKNKDFAGILNKQLWARSTEYTALATLKFCFPVEFKSLKHSEAPDLQDVVNMYAIEVTEATSEIEARTIGLWLRLNQPGISEAEKDSRRSDIHSSGYELKCDGMLGHPVREILDEQRILTQTYSKKLHKIISYKKKGFMSVDLFIDYEKPFISDDPKEVFGWLKSATEEHNQRFDRVFIRYVGGLLILDFEKNEISDIEISHEDRYALGNLGRMAAEGEIKDDDPIWNYKISIKEKQMLPQCYKQTEIGVIPEDWDVKYLNDFGDVVSGGTPSTSVGEYWDGDIVWCTPSDITSTRGKYIFKTDRNISYQGLKNSAATVLPSKSILLCTRATIGELKLSGVPMATNQGFKNLHPNATANVDYLYYLLQTKKKDMVELAIGSTFLEISKKALCSIALQTPSLPEQKRIAEALSDVDSMISSLEKLIAKKKAVKQGAMQELLTGKKRLPGFEGAWRKCKLKDVLTVGHGQSQHAIEDVNGKYPILATGGIIGRTNSFLYDQPSVLIGRKGTIDKPQYMETPFWTIDTLFYTKIGTDYHAKYIFYVFCLIDWLGYNEASGVPSLSASVIENIDVIIPALREQAAIASILSDMDNEIEALERKLEKTRHIKQGMMQQLLTGKIRLV